MRINAKISAAALAGLMALSMTACGAAPTNRMPGNDYNRTYQNGEIYNGNRTYRQTMPSDRTAAGQDADFLVDNTRRSANQIGNDMKRSARTATNDVKRTFDQALENGRVTDHRGTGSTVRQNRTTTAQNNNGTQRTTNAGVSLTGVR